MKKIISIVSIFLAQAATAQNISPGVFTDTIRNSPDTSVYVKWHRSNAFKVAAVPAALIGYSITIMEHRGLYSSRDAYDYLRENYPDFHTRADDYLSSVPVALMYGLDLAGVKSRNNWVNQTLILGIAQAVNGFLTRTVKDITHIERPDGSDDLSFPSGHTSGAFVTAEILHQEFKEKSIWISVAGYSVAATVGALRMLNNRHWLSDVVAGAGVGILSVKLTYLMYPKIHKKACSENAGGL